MYLRVMSLYLIIIRTVILMPVAFSYLTVPQRTLVLLELPLQQSSDTFIKTFLGQLANSG